MTDAYEPDEFDEIVRGGGPVGVHRAPRPWWTRVVAPVLVFLLAGAAAYVIANYLWNRDVATPGGSPTPTVTQSIEQSVTPSPSTSATNSQSASPTPTATVNFGANVSVLNGAGVSGLAAKNQKILEGAGFTTVAASNLASPKPAANVVVYEVDAMKATAEAVAKALGISEIALDVTQSGSDVEVQLVTDPSK